MRLLVLAATAGALFVSVLSTTPQPASADKSRMGCDTTTEVWDATLGKCQPGTPKYKRAAAEPVAPAEVKAAPKKAPAKKAGTPKKAAATKKAGAAKVSPAPGQPPAGNPPAAKKAPAEAK